MTAADIDRLFPDGRKAVSQAYADPHFAQVVEEMKRNRFFTLQQGWVKYLGSNSDRKKYGYSQYCELFYRFAAVTDVVATLQHEPGKAMFVDWAGPTLPVVDTVTGEAGKSYFYVVSMPFSRLVFANMKQEVWNQAHVNALVFIGRVPQLIVFSYVPRTIIEKKPLWQAVGRDALLRHAQGSSLVSPGATREAMARREWSSWSWKITHLRPTVKTYSVASSCHQAFGAR